MSEIHLNKFEKEKRVIELHLEGKTIRDIAQEIHMGFKDIGRIIKTYEKQQAAIASKEKLKSDSSNIKKKLSKSSQAFKLFREGKKLTEVAIDLEIFWNRNSRNDIIFFFYHIKNVIKGLFKLLN
jgi:transposase